MFDFPSTSLVLGACAALLVGVSKTGVPGASIPAVALMAMAFDENAKLSVGAMVPVLIFADLFAVTHYWRHTQWNRLWELFPFVVIGMVPGYLFLWYIPTTVFRPALGVIVLALLSMHFARKRGLDEAIKRGWFMGLSGVLAGFGTVVANAAGPVMSVYLLSKRLDKMKFMGTSAWFFFLVNLSKIPGHVFKEVITTRTALFSAVVAPCAAVGAIAGILVLRRIPQKVFESLVLLLAGAAALQLIFSGS